MNFIRKPRNYITKGVKTLKVKKYLNRWKSIICSLTERLKIIKMSVLPKLIQECNPSSIKIPIVFLIG